MNIKTLIGITLGDPSGIGPEITLRTLNDLQKNEEISPVIFGDKIILEQAKQLTRSDLNFREIALEEIREYNSAEIPFISTDIMKEAAIPGVVDNDCGRAAYVALNLGIDAGINRHIDALVTNPIEAESLKLAGCSFHEQNSLLKDKTKCDNLETILLSGALRIFFLTNRLPFQNISDSITKEKLIERIRQAEVCLKQMGVLKPALAVAALNPPDLEKGFIGKEERQIIRPVIEIMQRELRDVRGPVAADTVFHQAKEGKFDGVLALYHDQGYIAAKILDFNRTITLILEQPFLLVSPAHGTAFDIAGRGIANHFALLEAVHVACKYKDAAGEIKFKQSEESIC